MQNSHSLKLAHGSIRHAIIAVQPERLIKESLRLKNGQLFIKDTTNHQTTIDLDPFESIYLIGAGKATAGMAIAIRKILANRVSGGALTIPYGSTQNIQDISITYSSHPVPDSSGVKGTKKIMEILRKTSPNDLVIVLLSGGGSSLMPLPPNDLSLEKKRTITNSLLLSGAPIEEINIVRKHLSRIKGGQLLRYMNKKCRLISLIISDVIGDRLDVIASGPTYPDPSTYDDAAGVLRKYGLWEADRDVKNAIEQGIRKHRQETLKPSDEIFNRVTNLLIGNNDIACTAAANYLRSQGIEAYKLGTKFDGEAKYFGRKLATLAKKLQKKRSRIAFILGGETVVKVNKAKKYGLGGRNQEAMVAAAITLQDFQIDRNITILCAGTDGIDGNSKAAGAFLDSRVLSAIKERNLDAHHFLRTHNSYCFFKQLDSLIITGQTGTNVNDISIVCKTK